MSQIDVGPFIAVTAAILLVEELGKTLVAKGLLTEAERVTSVENAIRNGRQTGPSGTRAAAADLLAKLYGRPG